MSLLLRYIKARLCMLSHNSSQPLAIQLDSYKYIESTKLVSNL